ncbi:MAG: hypothetical protein F6J97_17855 [Leptolyngbya sp. SIO4C1]|nr:hypothetical protein [Leptolyngbya sp. SIO4C1]
MQAKRRWTIGILCAIALIFGGWLHGVSGGIAPALTAEVNFFSPKASTAALRDAFAQADQAAVLAQTASSAQQWDEVVAAWGDAISPLQSIAVDSPERAFAQRKMREYLQNQAAAQKNAEKMSLPYVFPSLGSPVLDEQLMLYMSYVSAMGTPDILIVGSSRSLQGIDPQILQRSLRQRGYDGLRVYNFSINGATAQVLNFVLQRMLSPDYLPKLIVWGDGSRAFNSARLDATFASILKSPGYRAVLAGETPSLASEAATRLVVGQPSAINAYGFLPVSEPFDPTLYYQTYPRVSGRYDGFYNPFALEGLQDVSLQSLASYLRRQNVSLVYVNLPLSGDYLDAYRSEREQAFQQFLQSQSRQQDFGVIDLVTQWRTRDAYFADPSHLNQAGAAAIAQQLAGNPLILSALAPAA